MPTNDVVLVLRTCFANMTSHGGFRWPESGPVAAPDWSPVAECGRGLHGLLWGEGDGSLLDWSDDARWLVVEVPAGSTVDLAGKVKFPRGEVVFCGDRLGATSMIAARRPGAIVGGTATAGYGGTATAGDGGTATAGYEGTLSLRWWDGARYRIAVFYVGEDGIEPGQPYRCEQGKAVRVETDGKAA